eukprot:CAMPEP_0184645438 /NCGR_PEP_ID=MMETSP0308-20130426/1908_1 /TAXON_ID=38269 /ORGANISM="Gloeochaete witrockiana, Strain SAG 46.84" /LENGTH=138 /DNA_ID=CAMNT_0027074421 /DNA_START=95 /DNA_END=511 /DNA_ORIENTATION=-
MSSPAVAFVSAVAPLAPRTSVNANVASVCALSKPAVRAGAQMSFAASPAMRGEAPAFFGRRLQVAEVAPKAASFSFEMEKRVPEIVAEDSDLEEKPKGFGFTSGNELVNGRSAMIGFVSALLVELVTGKGVLHFLGLI